MSRLWKENWEKVPATLLQAVFDRSRRRYGKLPGQVPLATLARSALGLLGDNLDRSTIASQAENKRAMKQGINGIQKK
jgi:hypothetical protein